MSYDNQDTKGPSFLCLRENNAILWWSVSTNKQPKHWNSVNYKVMVCMMERKKAFEKICSQLIINRGGRKEACIFLSAMYSLSPTEIKRRTTHPSDRTEQRGKGPRRKKKITSFAWERWNPSQARDFTHNTGGSSRQYLLSSKAQTDIRSFLREFQEFHHFLVKTIEIQTSCHRILAETSWCNSTLIRSVIMHLNQ